MQNLNCMVLVFQRIQLRAVSYVQCWVAVVNSHEIISGSWIPWGKNIPELMSAYGENTCIVS